MTITEKELAEKLGDLWSDDATSSWETVARRASELLGVTLAPEKPEPGTWHIVDAGGYKGRPAHAAFSGCLIVYVNDAGETYTFAKSDKWPALTPARVVPAEPVEVELDLTEARDLYNGQRYGHAREFETLHEDVQGTLGAAINDALAKHGGARELPTWDQVREAIAGAPRLPKRVISATSAADAVMALLGGGDDE